MNFIITTNDFTFIISFILLCCGKFHLFFTYVSFMVLLLPITLVLFKSYTKLIISWTAAVLQYFDFLIPFSTSYFSQFFHTICGKKRFISSGCNQNADDSCSDVVNLQSSSSPSIEIPSSQAHDLYLDNKIEADTRIKEWGLPNVNVKDINGKIITINPECPVPFESEYFKGSIIFMIRTDGELSQYNRYANHFKKRQRKFEVQIQGKMKSIPKGTLMMGGELNNKMNLGLVTRTLVSMIMRFCVKLISNMRYGFGDDPVPDGKYEKAYIAFPLFRAMDRVVVTSAGSIPPPLGHELPETDEERNRRRSGKTPDLVFDMESTYSFSFHSMYIDFARWRICNVPGYKYLDMHSFIGNQPLNIVVYEIDNYTTSSSQPTTSTTNHDNPHYICNRRYLSVLEVSYVANHPKINSKLFEDKANSSNKNHNNNIDSSFLSSGNDGVRRRGSSLTEPVQRSKSSENLQPHSYHNSERTTTTTTNITTTEPYILSGNNCKLVALPAKWERIRRGKTIIVKEEDSDDDDEDELYDENSEQGQGTEGPASNTGFNRYNITYNNCIGVKNSITTNARHNILLNNRRSNNIIHQLSELDGGAAARVSSISPYFILGQEFRIIKVSQWEKRNKKCESKDSDNSEEVTYSTSTSSHSNNNIKTSKEKKKKKEEKEDDNIIRSDDIVYIQSLNNSSYLRINRGWWVGWVHVNDDDNDNENENDDYDYDFDEETDEDNIRKKITSSSSSTTSLGVKNQFRIKITDESNNTIRGEPLLPDTIFRLRSAYWPSYEVCCLNSEQPSSTNSTGVSDSGERLLAMSLFHRNSHKPSKWMDGTKLNPLFLCVVDERRKKKAKRRLGMRSGSFDSISALSTAASGGGFDNNSNSNSSRSKISGYPSSSTSLLLSHFILPRPHELSSFHVSVIGWVDMMYRTTGLPCQAFILVSTLTTSSSGIRSWSSLRTLKEISVSLRFLEKKLRLGIDPNITVKRNESHSSISSSKRSTSNKHRQNNSLLSTNNNLRSFTCELPNHLSPMDREFRLLNAKFNFLMDYQGKLSPSLGSTSKSALVGTSSTSNKLTVTSTSMPLPHQIIEGRKIITKEVETEHTALDDTGISVISDYIGSNNSSKKRDNKGTAAEQELYSQYDTLNLNLEPNQLIRSVLLTSLSKLEVLDTWCLVGDAQQQVPESALKEFRSNLFPQLTIFALRALWSCHWREEIVVIYPSHLTCYVPRQNKAVFVLRIFDIIGVSDVSPDDNEYIPGLHMVRIETVGRVHYLSFMCPQNKNRLTTCLLEQITELRSDNISAYSIAAGAAARGIVSPQENFAILDGPWVPKGRLILNIRRFHFDIHHRSEFDWDVSRSTSKLLDEKSGGGGGELLGTSSSNVEEEITGDEPEWMLAAKLLRNVFDLDPSCCDEKIGQGQGQSRIMNRYSLVRFLDNTSLLAKIKLDTLDLSTPETTCFFVNIFHTLLMHGRLVLGTSTAFTWSQFFCTVSYDIGGEVFSLQEIYQCVCRGQLTKPFYPPSLWPLQPPDHDHHYKYSLNRIDQRINFLINTGSLSFPPIIFLVTPDTLYSRLNEASQLVLNHSIRVDKNAKIVTLPKICEIYRNDFGNDNQIILRHCLRYLEKQKWEDLICLFSDQIRPPTVKFRTFKFESHCRLQLVA